MYVFEEKNGIQTVREAGYYLNGNESEKPQETKIVYRATDSLPIETFWAKIDDYGDKFVCTFLFPDEY